MVMREWGREGRGGFGACRGLAGIGIEAFDCGGDEARFAAGAGAAIGVFGGGGDDIAEVEGAGEDLLEASAEGFAREVLGEGIDEGVRVDEEGDGGLDV